MKICGKKIDIKKCVKLYENKKENPFYKRDSKREDRTNFSQLERNVYSDRAKEMWKSGMLKKYSYTLISLDDKNEIKTELFLNTALLSNQRKKGIFVLLISISSSIPEDCKYRSTFIVSASI